MSVIRHNPCGVGTTGTVTPVTRKYEWYRERAKIGI
jgi:hypothetical protein